MSMTPEAHVSDQYTRLPFMEQSGAKTTDFWYGMPCSHAAPVDAFKHKMTLDQLHLPDPYACCPSTAIPQSFGPHSDPYHSMNPHHHHYPPMTRNGIPICPVGHPENQKCGHCPPITNIPWNEGTK